ncbi:hypothetical protein PHLCEN_2v860 [Hermanssonia centrifuga]|uniref:O-methyltransferase C-terminal domain-containing protein n=1 Tax=Hermanssonia centrifuga TaxID=98765 RepID=A0A2R6S4T4_9APHY|nr:hypothetical protein PHLCEN_2v860 [Hermanssonia centrifuga]
MATQTPLSALAAIVVSSIQTIESAYSNQGMSFPSLDDSSFRPDLGSLQYDPLLVHTTNILVAAAMQIIATVRPPMETIHDMSSTMFTSAALGLAVETDIPTIISTSGTPVGIPLFYYSHFPLKCACVNAQGLHVRDIGSKAGIDESKAARILRYLASRHMFKEITPNVFANNRISAAFVRTEETDGTTPDFDEHAPTALVSWFADECLKSSTHMAEHIRIKPKDVVAPFNMAFKTSSNLWDWFEEPGNERRLHRFSTLYKANSSQWPSSLFTRDIYWRDLTESDVVVDVGGSVGGLTNLLVEAFPKPRYIVQDLQKVIAQAEKFWATERPAAISSGKVTLQAHNFFETQPVKHARVYVIRSILRDWSTAACHEILSHLRAAAGPTTKLVAFEAIMPYACEDTGHFTPTSAIDSPPYPLLPNVSSLGAFLTMADIAMLTMLDGQERTVAEMEIMAQNAGWKLETVEPGLPFAGFVFSPL